WSSVAATSISAGAWSTSASTPTRPTDTPSRRSCNRRRLTDGPRPASLRARPSRARAWRSRPLSKWEQPACTATRRLTTALVRLEIWYLPRIERGATHLRTPRREEWEAYAEGFDPVET